jgi:acetyltransferase-like isoleucine patch superfamily enzyme
MRGKKEISKYFTNFKIVVAKMLGGLFFDKKYLRGKFFGSDGVGWLWVWRSILWQKIFRMNAHVPYPVSPFILIPYPESIEFDVDSLNVFQGIGNYFCTQWNSKIIIGKNVWIAPNVGIISANHDLENPGLPGKGEVTKIGDDCWIGMNATILPGVEIGAHTIVGAGSVVTKSFPGGKVIIGGNPACIIKSVGDVPE